jgi:hypothetical protein
VDVRAILAQTTESSGGRGAWRPDVEGSSPEARNSEEGLGALTSVAQEKEKGLPQSAWRPSRKVWLIRHIDPFYSFGWGRASIVMVKSNCLCLGDVGTVRD